MRTDVYTLSGIKQMTGGKLLEAQGAQLMFRDESQGEEGEAGSRQRGICTQVANLRRFTAENNTVNQLYSN